MKLETEKDGIEWMRRANALAVVAAWNALGVFDRLRAGPLASAELGLDARAVAITVPVLQHVGLLETDGEWIALSESAERLLASGGMPTARSLETLRDLGQLTRILQDGGPARNDAGQSKGTRGGTSDDPEQTARFLDFLFRVSEGPARSTFAWLAPGLTPGASVLDLGGGHGRYARVFADAGHAATLFDQPHVVALARKRHGDALRYLEGDFHRVPSFGGPYDLVLLCNVVHGETAEANASIVRRAAESLRPGGRIALRDMFLDERTRDPESAVFFGMTMLLYTDAGSSPTIARARDWFARAGLVAGPIVVLDSHQIVTAHRP